MFDGNGLLLTNDAYLTLSIASDGVNIAGQPNAIAAKFDAIAARNVWENAILSAFQAWATHANADIGVVPDGGKPFGTAGPTHGDSRFGDIRIGAISMDPLVGGESTPIDRLVGGTWQADVIFNTNFNFQSVSDIYEIALHEAGHVFGLEDNTDPNSPLHGGTIPTATAPDANDITNLQALYGTRLDDFNEHDRGSATSNNDSFTSATVLVVADSAGVTPGSAPVLAYGDITTPTDADFFRLKVPDTYSGSVNVTVRSAGISLLAPHLQAFDEHHQLVEDLVSTSTTGDTLLFAVPNAAPNAIYFFEVTGASSSSFGLGGYSIEATFNDVAQVDSSVLNQYRDSDLRTLSQDEIRKLIVPSEDHFLNEDANADDNLVNAVVLQSRTEFTDPARFEVVGSISDAADSDFYRVKSPQNVTAPANVLTVTVRTLSAGRLVPTIEAFDRNQNPLPVTVLANGGGELVVQVSGIESNRNYYLKVAANDANGPLNLGNYQLTASFRDQAANFQTFAAGTLAAGATQNVHTLYVAEPQLFHILLQAGAAVTTGPAAIVAAIYNQAGQIVYRVAAAPGESQSQGAVLLAPGIYTVQISSLTFQGPLQTAITYTLSGQAISDPFASDPNDQTTNPFINPDPSLGGEFLYPGGVPSDDPFLWDSFISSLQGSSPPDLQTQIRLLLGDWWSWFWGQTGVNGPPLAQADSYSTGLNTTLTVSAGAGVLGNDFDPENDPIVAAVTSAPRVGALSLNPDGSFQYTSPVGFNGTVEFSYQASDFNQLSNQTTVVLSVGLIGDYDHNGAVSQPDFSVWRSNFGSATRLDADGNGNGIVDAADYVSWRYHQALAGGASDTTASATITTTANTSALSSVGAAPSQVTVQSQPFTAASAFSISPAALTASPTAATAALRSSAPGSIPAEQALLTLIDASLSRAAAAPPSVLEYAAIDDVFSDLDSATEAATPNSELNLAVKSKLILLSM